MMGKKAAYAIASSASRQPSSLWQSIRVGAARLGWPHSFLDPMDSPDTENKKENQKQPMVGEARSFASNKTQRKPIKPEPSEGEGGKTN
ncbi:hypothetical protein OPV22_032864 [Ensete ventricosum]|uniref:Uncharacterized protein n=1 Tax=Ensete ventricosum TaxID=4639 RepID=A0AAV8PSL7_ENSVE|nr:hypothetical protein OPV22_032864 [Ensete ventricosum]